MKNIELKQYLDGLEESMPEAFFRLAEVIQYQVFELCGNLLPYMMNDAIEYYLCFENARLTGNYEKEQQIVSARIARQEEQYALIVKQEAGNVFTLHFSELRENVQCYQYHNIGHFWVNGQEQWRQLVYIIGTIFDKYLYFGDRFCNEKEKEIMHLIEFAPFHAWSPIHEPLAGWYDDHVEGIKTMEYLAERAEDFGYFKLIKWYRRLPFEWMSRLLSRRLLVSKRQRLYEVIWNLIEEASSMYPVRDYGREINHMIECKRQNLHECLMAHEFTGNYPLYQKSGIQIIATEEHPFTIMEKEDYAFKIQLMISECMDSKGRNAGFFKGKGRKGWIVNEKDFD